jgi:hypothetical protein
MFDLNFMPMVDFQLTPNPAYDVRTAIRRYFPVRPTQIVAMSRRRSTGRGGQLRFYNGNENDRIIK